MNIIIISEGSCDTDNKSIDVENPHRNKLHFKIY